MTGSPVSGFTRRDLLRLGLAATGAGVLGGCARGGGEGSVSWEAIPSYSLQTTDPNRAEYLRTQLRAWHNQADTRIEPRVTSADTAAAMAKLLLQASQGRASDVAQVDGYIFGRLASYASVLDEQMAAAGLRLDDWFPALQDVMAEGTDTVRALQFTTDVRVLYYRKDVIDEPPATWDDVMSVASSLSGDGSAVLFPAGRGEGAVTTTLWPLFWGQGVELFDDTGRVAFQSGRGYEAMREALAVVASAVGDVTPRRVATFATEDDQVSDVVAGRVAMFLGGNWQAAALDTAMEDQSFFETWDVAPLPTITGDQPVTSAGGWVWAGFTDDNEELNAGMDWVINAYVSDEGMASWCSIGGYLPPRQSVYDLPEYEQNPFTPMFREHLANFARSRPGVRDYLQTSDSLQIALSSVAAGTANPDQALDEALNRIV